ncbi:MAG: biosynthetic arginine decarboxylase [Deltaproteobacteria bacterium]|nr:biosynthetic arginine decarboxylase [Deltaproteobacteria bacterium]
MAITSGGSKTKAWTVQDAADAYNIAEWGQGYFRIDDGGSVIVNPGGPQGPRINLKRVVDDLVRRGLSLPLLLRFSDILRDRVRMLYETFDGQIRSAGYKNRYIPVMPIKVNQQRHVIEELLEFGAPFGLGLEAGSKPELLISIALMGNSQGMIVCNGYKDAAYIETALLSQRLGIHTLIIADRYEELETIVGVSKRLGLKPHIGVRTKLSARGAGRWAESGGDRSKFGLASSEMVRAVELLEREDMLDRLECMHFHIGSQITAIRSIKEALSEAVRFYVHLHKMGAPLGYLDVGGGLAVDYDGSKSNFHASKNYTLEEYAADIVDTFGTTFAAEGIPAPAIISESGRALVAHHSVLVFNVLGVNEVTPRSTEEVARTIEAIAEPHQILKDLLDIYRTVSRKNSQESYHDAVQLKEDALSLFRHGIIDLRTRARVEELFWAIAMRIWRIVGELDYIPDELEGLDRELADIFFCNFSIFQSVPDHWAVDALFPVMPIHRLNEKPTRLAILADLTCDSDGKMDKFIDLHDVKSALELHTPRKGEPYFLGVFLVGAYQEVLGDLHNLFGDVNAVHIVAEPGGYAVKHIVTGDTIEDVVQYVGYDKRTLMSGLRQAVEVALGRGAITFEQSAALVRHFEAGLANSTYLEDSAMAEVLLNSVIPTSSDRLAAELRAERSEPEPEPIAIPLPESQRAS